MKNQVIKALTPEHGAKIIQYWKDRGVDTGDYNGSSNEKGGDTEIYYGVVNGIFGNRNIQQVEVVNAEIIKLPQPSEDSVKQTYIFKEGDPVISKVHPGVTGFTVCGFEDKKRMYLICSPTWNGGHSGAGTIPVWGKVPDTSDNSCWWVHEDSIVLDNQLKENDIDISNINVGDYVKIIDKPANGRKPIGWNPYGEMDYLYGTWQEVRRVINPNDIEVPAPNRDNKDTWSISVSDITAVKSYNPNIYISGCDTAVKGGDATVIGTVDIATMRIEVEYDPIMDYKPTLSRPPESRMVLGLDILPVPSLRVSRKNIKK